MLFALVDVRPADGVISGQAVGVHRLRSREVVVQQAVHRHLCARFRVLRSRPFALFASYTYVCVLLYSKHTTTKTDNNEKW